MKNKDNKPLGVLVTGVGSIIGYGVIKSLRKIYPNLRIVGLDRNPIALGRVWCNSFYSKPTVPENSNEYLEFWTKLIESESLDLIIPGIDVDVEFLDEHRKSSYLGKVALALNNPEIISMAKDKWLTIQKMKEKGFPVIPSTLPGKWSDLVQILGPAPFIMKPRKGSGSRGIVNLSQVEDLEFWVKKSGTDFIIQKIVGKDDEEYTVGVFGFGDGTAIDPIVMRRSLGSSGFTQFAEVVMDKQIIEFVNKLNRVFCPVGPTNYQFRKDKGEVYLLEINPRVSSSNSIRTAFGYNEAMMCVEYFVNKNRPQQPRVTLGRATRYQEDFIELK